MIRKSLYVLLWSSLITGTVFAKINVDLNYKYYATDMIIRGNNVFERNIINLLDENDESFVLLNRYAMDKRIRVVFKKKQKIDGIVFVNRADSYSHIRRIRISVVDGMKTNFSAVFELENRAGRQAVNLNLAQGREYVFELLDVYPGEIGDKVSLYGLEFWSGRQKINPGSLDEMRNAFRVSYRNYVRRLFLGLFSQVARVEFESLDRTMSHWESVGIPTARIYRDANDNSLGILMEMTEDKEYHGFIYVGIDAGSLVNERVGDFDYHRRLADKMTIGEWSIDKNGHVWIKLGKGAWKDGGELYFSQTDIGNVVSIGAP